MLPADPARGPPRQGCPQRSANVLRVIDVAVRLRVAGRPAIGPGKIRLLELIQEHGSIAAAGREMEMAYSHAWTLVNSLNDIFAKPVIDSRPGGAEGGGARLTPFGCELVRRYRAIERRARAAAGDDVNALETALPRARRRPTVARRACTP
jgi:molybdate transport system regulatory protein